MKLILDLGNTNKKAALFQNGELLELKQYPVMNQKILLDVFCNFPGITHCILSSVIRHPASLTRFIASRCSMIELTEKTAVPIINRYRSRNTLGKDRLAAAVAAAHHFPDRDVLVINAGTCITYDLINSKKEYLGGAISPGIMMRFQSLHTFTGKLPLVSLKPKGKLIGNNTESSVHSGVVNGVLTEIEGIAGKFRLLYPDLKVILSGGDHIYLNKQLKISIFALPNIVIQGLYQILEFNVPKSK